MKWQGRKQSANVIDQRKGVPLTKDEQSQIQARRKDYMSSRTRILDTTDEQILSSADNLNSFERYRKYRDSKRSGGRT